MFSKDWKFKDLVLKKSEGLLRYTRAPEDEVEHEQSSMDHLLNSSGKNGDCISLTSQLSRASSRQLKYWTIFNIIIFAFSILALGYTVYANHTRPLDKQWLLKKTSYFSPVLERVTIPTSIKQADGALYESTHPTAYRNTRKSDPAVDAAWLDLEYIHTFPITKSDVLKLGKDPLITVKYPISYGLGSEAYVAQIDVFHQIHCLNMLRRTVWAEFPLAENATEAERKKQSKPKTEWHWTHMSHCVDMLMQNLMCQGSADTFTFNWMEGQQLPFPDFYMNRQCRDFETIVQWQKTNGIGPDRARNFTRPVGEEIVEIPAPKEFHETEGDDHVS